MRPANAALHFRAGLQRAEDGDRPDRRQSEFGRDVGRDADKADDLDVELLACRSHRLEIGPAVVAQAQLQRVPDDRLRDGSACVASWLRIAVRMKSVRLE